MKLLALTSTRADFGILRPLLDDLHATDVVDLGLLVTGTQLSAAHGSTVTEVERSGLPIAARAPILPSPGSTPISPITPEWRIAASTLARSIEVFADVVDRYQPDRALVLGDRFEAFGFATACHLADVPLAHIHGGEVTTGAFDDGFRHGITKLSALHLVAAEAFRRRVIQLGEDPASVHTIGALGLDAIRRRLAGRPAIDRRATAIVTYHPATRSDEWGAETMSAILRACLGAELDRIIVTRPNVDPGSAEINRVIDEHRTTPRIEIHASLGSARYLDEVARAQVVIGNSSSGIIEAPFLGTPSIDVGHRQDGRPRARSTIDLPQPTVTDLIAAIERTAGAASEALQPTVYGDGHAAGRAVDLIAADWGLDPKPFFDLTDLAPAARPSPSTGGSAELAPAARPSPAPSGEVADGRRAGSPAAAVGDGEGGR